MKNAHDRLPGFVAAAQQQIEPPVAIIIRPKVRGAQIGTLRRRQSHPDKHTVSIIAIESRFPGVDIHQIEREQVHVPVCVVIGPTRPVWKGGRQRSVDFDKRLRGQMTADSETEDQAQRVPGHPEAAPTAGGMNGAKTRRA